MAARSLGLALVVATAAGCHTVGCTEKGCSGSLAVHVVGAPAGALLTLTAGDGTETACVVPISGSVTCGDEGGVLVVADDAVDVTLSLPRLAEEPSPTLGVRVEDDGGAVLLDDDVATTWTGPLYPNGPACDAPFGCWTGRASATVVP